MVPRIMSAAAITAFAGLTTACSSSQTGPDLPNATQAEQDWSTSPAVDRVRIREFADLPGHKKHWSPAAIATAWGSLWVADDIDNNLGSSAIVQIATSGKQQHFSYYYGPNTADFRNIAIGSDDALWITDASNGQIVRMTNQGAYTSYPLYGVPYGIAAGPDSALWFTFYAYRSVTNEIGRITTTGQATFYPLSAAAWQIAAGRDGALWFTQPAANEIGRITTLGDVTEYSKGISAGSNLNDISAGPDGALWFTEGAGRIGSITTHGKVAEYSQGITASEHPMQIAAGPDRAMWFSEFETPNGRVGASKIGRIAMHGKITEYAKDLNPTAGPTAITQGPDGRMWFVGSFDDKTGRVTL